MVNNSRYERLAARTAPRRLPVWRAIACTIALLASARLANAADQMYFPAVDNVTNVIVNLINNETVRIDISAWYLTEHAISIALVNRFQAGVPVRVIGDRGAIFEIDPNTKNEFYFLANAGVPIRLRYNPTWYPEIDHWKTGIFKGQGVAEFGSANWTPFQLAPSSSTNFDDETAMTTDDPVLVGAFLTKFDTIWNDTATEPESVISGPPYMKNWYDACALESACSDFSTVYPTPAPMTINTARLEPDNRMPADLIWGQGPDFNNRLVAEINNEASAINFVIYRLTVDNITQALLSKKVAGVPIRIILEPNEYLNRKWPEFWLTHANLDKLWAAGVPIVQRVHQGLTHMKMLVTSNYATNASSNYAAHWQRDQDYFVPAATKPTVYAAMKNRFATMWGDTTNFGPFTPQPADAATLETPTSGATAVSTTPTFTWDRAAFATSYDVYVGTSQGSLSKVGTVPADLTDSPPTTYSFTPTTALAAGTTHYWQIASRTFATDVNPSIISWSPVWSFTTGGAGGGGSLPSPWVDQDVGTTGLAGSASYSSGVFTVSGAGSDIWGSADSFNFASQSFTGDGQIVARVTAEQNTSAYAKAGVMVRDSTSATASNVILDVRPDGSIEFMARPSSGAATNFIAGSTQAVPAWLKLVRSGSTVTGSISADGSAWTTVGSTSVTMGTSAQIGLAVASHNTSALNTSTFDNVAVSAGSTPPPPPPPSATNIVIYASDFTSVNGLWSKTTDSTAAGGVKLATPDTGFAQTGNAVASPANYADVTFNAVAGTSYTFWIRLQALNNSKLNDSVWVQFSDALVNGGTTYATGTTNGLAVNLATDSTGASDQGWGWVNSAYWIAQGTTVTFPTTGSHTVRVQVREDGVQFDQIVLSPTTYFNASASCPNTCSGAPGPVSNDSTIVAK